jgi:TolA-binding protein
LSFRKSHEAIWKEVDRQIAMEPMKKYDPQGKEVPSGWQSAFELGEISKASEVITADIMRLVFPASRNWQEPHCKPPLKIGQDGRPVPVDPKKQKAVDGILRALMSQQQLDFGLKSRVELSVKEALHHGSFVATVEWEKQNKVYDGQGVESLEAPVWVPHSMWNCYPDSSQSVIPGAIFYPGSMMIVSYMPRQKVLALQGDGYMNIDPKKITKKKGKDDTDDVELVTYYGDLTIERDDGDIYLPNSKCITANDTIIYYRANPLPFPEVIYQGYERQDIRDPYFTSPVIKNSPLHKVATILANRFIDGVDLWTMPPGWYDGNDSYLVQTGGPQIHPGSMNATKGISNKKVEFMQVGDPKAALSGLTFALTKLEEGTGVNAIRSGVSASDRKTATEVERTEQRGEVRTVDFVDKLELGALRPFLYMSHELNLKHLQSYSFYCPEKGLPDFLSFAGKDLPKIVHFEVVGSKGILGELQRTQKVAAVTAFAATTPGFAELLNAPDILKDMYEDAGVKSAETYIRTENDIPLPVRAKLQQAEQMIQELQQKLQEAEANMQAEMAKIALEKHKTEEELRLERRKAEQEYQLAVKEMADKFTLAMIELRAELRIEQEKSREESAANREKTKAEVNSTAGEMVAKMESASLGHSQEIAKAADALVKTATSIAEKASKKRKAKIKAPSGKVYEVDED